MPPATDGDYEFEGKLDTVREAPVCGFNGKFYGCKKDCIRAWLDILDSLHECKGRNLCGSYRALQRVPKRLRKWQIDIPVGKEKAWGLNAIFAVSGYKVTLYHLVIVAGPLVFWGLWLKKWPRDLQNASVPLLTTIGLCSLFWALFASFHRDEKTYKN